MNTKPITVAASILASNFGRLDHECERIEAAGADWLHLDVMDGHFVDNLSIGPVVVEAISRVAKVPLDTHLMIERPDHFAPRFAPFVQNITIHVEPSYDIGGTLRAIHQAGCTAGLAISPPTDFALVEPFLDQIDLLLVMTVNPGFGGQAFIPETMEKVKRAAELRQNRGLDFHIEVDGGINEETGTTAWHSGANVFVAGTALFRAADPKAEVDALKRVARSA
jgi:ribulose-phosphate 3-epimerase